MAIFEKEDKETKSYIALLDTNGNMVAIINPMNKVSTELLVNSLVAKGLNVETRISQPEITELEL